MFRKDLNKTFVPQVQNFDAQKAMDNSIFDTLYLISISLSFLKTENL